MLSTRRRVRRPLRSCTLGLAFGLVSAVAGCRLNAPETAMPVCQPMPRELSKVVLPEYTIEPPDVLVIEAVHVVPRAPYLLKTLDVVAIQAWGTLPDAPIQGVYPIGPGGLVNLGARYGSVKISGITDEQAQTVVTDHLRHRLREVVVSVTLAEMSAKQQVEGQHLVKPDGTVTLGSYGSVSVVGQSIGGAKASIEAYLSQFFENPEVAVDVFAYNSKIFYIITEGAGFGDGVHRFPITGNETVLDAVSYIRGTTEVSSKKIWVARPQPGTGNVHKLPVDWEAITSQGSTATNYQILPGDRVFIAEDRMVAFDTRIGKLLAPLERMIGFTLLGTGAATRLSGPVMRGGGNSSGTF